MRIAHLSDTHGLHRQVKGLPAADVIVHSGDISHNGTEDEVLDFLNWFIELPYPHLFFSFSIRFFISFSILFDSGLSG